MSDKNTVKSINRLDWGRRLGGKLHPSAGLSSVHVDASPAIAWTGLGNTVLSWTGLGMRGVLLSLAVGICLSLGANAWANESAKRFDIKEQPLAQALMEFGAQSGLTVVVPSAVTEGK